MKPLQEKQEHVIRAWFLNGFLNNIDNFIQHGSLNFSHIFMYWIYRKYFFFNSLHNGDTNMKKYCTFENHFS